MQPRQRSVLACCLCLALLASVSCRDPEEREPAALPQAGSAAGRESPSADHRSGAEAPPVAGQEAIDEVVYEVTGGFAGFQLELRIRKGGEAEVYDAGELVRQGQLSPGEWAELGRLMDEARLRELAGEHGRGDEGSVADAMHEVVLVRSLGDSVRVATAGGLEGLPSSSAFFDLTGRLRELALTLPAVDSGGRQGGGRQ